MKRSVAAAVMTAAALAVAAPAEGAVKLGSYSGETSQGLGVAFDVVREDGAKRLASVNFRVRLSCTDGDSFIARGNPGDNTFTITRRGRYGYTSTGADGASLYAFQGRIKGRRSRARGTIRWQVLFNEANEPDPDGSILCDSGRVTYTARR